MTGSFAGKVFVLGVSAGVIAGVSGRAEDSPRPAPAGPAVIQHVKVYAEPGRFGGWPANHGLWSWGDEILVGFSAGYFKDHGPDRHAIDRDRPEEHLLARSRDGGADLGHRGPGRDRGRSIPVGKALHGVTPPGLKEKPWRDCPGGIDFTHPDFALTVRMTDANAGPARFYYSTDRGQTWEGPFRLPLFGQKGIAARTDYVVNGKHDCLLFLTAAKANGREGRPFCVRTTDGGRTWEFVGWIGDEPTGYAIMPSTVRLGADELLTAIRCRDGTEELDRHLPLARRRQDAGQLDRPRPSRTPGTGNPAEPDPPGRRPGLPDLRLPGRAVRHPGPAEPGRRADVGRRRSSCATDGGGRDVGYPRSVQRPDGKVVTVYYFHDTPAGDRYVAATIWDPGPPGP